MTYQEALKARARLAYSATGLAKRAGVAGTGMPNTPDELATMQAMLAYDKGSKAEAAGKEMKSKANSGAKMYDVGKQLDAQNAESAGMAAEMADWDANYKAENAALERVKAGTATPEDYALAQAALNREMANERAGSGKTIDRAADIRQARNLGIGAGALGGLAAGGAAYGLTGLFPSLRKRRLLRALIALGVGGAAGVGAGVGTYKAVDARNRAKTI